MAEDSNTLITKIILDDSDFKRGIKNVQSQVKTDASVAERVNKKTWKEEDKRRRVEDRDRRERRKIHRDEEMSLRRINTQKARGYQADEAARRKERKHLQDMRRSGPTGGYVGGDGGDDGSGGGVGGRGRWGRGGWGRGLRRAGSRLGRRAGRMLLGAPIAAAGAIAGLVGSHATAGYGAFMNAAGVKASLHGLDGDIRQIDSWLGARLGYDINTMRSHGRNIARQTGSMSAVNQAAILSRYYGGDMGEVGSFMGVLTRGGSPSMGGPAGQKLLGRIMADAVKSGLNKSRAGEHLESVASMIQQVGSRQAVDVDAGGISGLLSLIGRHGGEGLRGARGMNVLAGIDQGIRSGGSTEGSEAFVLQTIGFGRPGSNMDYFEAKRIQERGLFGGKDGPNIDLLMGMLKNAQEYAGGSREGAAYYLVKDGLAGNATMDQILELWDSLDAAGGDPKKIKAAIKKIAEEAKPIEEKMLGINEDLLKEAQAQARDTNRLVATGATLYSLVRRAVTFLQRIVDKLLPPIVKFAERVVGPASEGMAHEQRTEDAVSEGANLSELVESNQKLSDAEVRDIYTRMAEAASEAQERMEEASRGIERANKENQEGWEELREKQGRFRWKEILDIPFSSRWWERKDIRNRINASYQDYVGYENAYKKDAELLENLRASMEKLRNERPDVIVNINNTGPEPADQRVSPLDADQTAGAPGGTQ